MKKSGKMKLLTGLLALALVVGTFAYFSKEMSIKNPFSTKEYGGETVEKFTPEDEWEPGGEVAKEVQVKNTGDYPLYVRIKFSEEWKRNDQLIAGTQLDSSDEAKFFPADAVTPAAGGSSVYKHLVGTEGSDAKWVNGNDGWYYYKYELEPKKTVTGTGETTTMLLDYVTLCAKSDMGTYEASAVKYALVDAGKTAEELQDSDYTLSAAPEVIPAGKELFQKVVVSLNAEQAGLAGANYTLTVTTQLLQADPDAAEDANWGFTPTAKANS